MFIGHLQKPKKGCKHSRLVGTVFHKSWMLSVSYTDFRVMKYGIRQYSIKDNILTFEKKKKFLISFKKKIWC